MGRPRRYSVEVRDRAVRLVSAERSVYDFGWAAICSIAAKFGCWAETLRRWVRRSERDGGLGPGLSSEQLVELTELRRENRELRRANEILRKASTCVSPRPSVRPPTEQMTEFVDEHRDDYGVEPVLC